MGGSGTGHAGGADGAHGPGGAEGPEARTVRPEPVGPPPSYDPELAAELDAFGEAPPPRSLEELPRRRAELDRMLPRPTLEELRAGGKYEVSERAVPGPPGGPEVSLLLVRPAGLAGRALPLVYHAHGGGMITGDHRVSVLQMLDPWVGGLTVAVASVAYRLAPEHPHPAPVEDCYAGLVWIAGHAEEAGIDPGRIVLVGNSAGGGLCAALALLARDRQGPPLLGQLLMSPMLDDRNDSPSARQMAALGVWDREANHLAWEALLGDARGGPDVSPYAAPARATDLSGLPPAFIDVGSAETFRDEDVAYASRIWRSGGSAELHVWPGGFHGFDGVAPGAALTRSALAARTEWLRRLLGKT
ncbi:alpha/beta hydrolase [Streptomyces sp. NPDC007088]|uniref:alpha/beta hydrolase n=1 Tax=Streptomyces sp. NPDC007088 TaxID=3364773 RepID=UPI0036A65B8B